MKRAPICMMYLIKVTQCLMDMILVMDPCTGKTVDREEPHDIYIPK